MVLPGRGGAPPNGSTTAAPVLPAEPDRPADPIHAPGEQFRKGVAISTWQNSADEGLSNWSRYAYQRWPFSCFGISTTRGKYKVGKSCDFWTR
jgi:hypothetical protein